MSFALYELGVIHINRDEVKITFFADNDHVFFCTQHAQARLLFSHAKVSITQYNSVYSYFLCTFQDAFSGYEFEARLNFKVHSAMALVR